MADDTSITDAATTDTQAGNGGESGKTFTQEQLNDLIAKEKGRIQAKYEGFDDLKAKAEKFDELEESKRSDVEKLTAERDDLRGKVTPAQEENLRLRVALEKKLDSELIDRLRGGTKEELEADADKLLERFGPVEREATFDGGARQGGSAQSIDDLIRGAKQRR